MRKMKEEIKSKFMKVVKSKIIWSCGLPTDKSVFGKVVVLMFIAIAGYYLTRDLDYRPGETIIEVVVSVVILFVILFFMVIAMRVVLRSGDVK